jgi:hypothetical protein
VSDRVVSILRTAVPTAWGALLGLLLPHIPWLPAAVSEWLQSVAVVEVIVGLCIVAWYAVWRWAEPRIPAWLVTLVLGSAKTPTYGAAIPAARATGGPVVQNMYIVGEGSPELFIPRHRIDPDLDAAYRAMAAERIEETEAEADDSAAGNDHSGFPYA